MKAANPRPDPDARLSAGEPRPLDERARALRRLVVRAMDRGGRGHLPSAASVIDILRVLYDDILKVRAGEPRWADRDRCILSKGHGCLALFAVLADKGFFPLAELDRFCKFDALLGGHPEVTVPGVDASTGALGHGLPIGVGMALAARLQGRPSRVFVVMGDGELNEGSVWEAALAAGQHQLGNLTAIVDYNKMQSYGPTRDIVDLESLTQKWRAFNFAVREVNGHDIGGLRAVLSDAPFAPDRPSALICHTVKGRGFGEVEHNAGWHHKSKLAPQVVDELYAALENA
jgi:transketolase